MNGTEWKEQIAPNCNIKQWQSAVDTQLAVKGTAKASPEGVLMELGVHVAKAQVCFLRGEVETRWGASGKPMGLPAELGQVALKLLEACNTWGVDLGQEMATIMEYNYAQPGRVTPSPAQERKDAMSHPIIENAEVTGHGGIYVPEEAMFNLNQWSKFVNDWAQSKGWNNDPLHVGDALMLMVTELAEAKEDDRKGRMETYLDETGKPCGFPSEIADTLIRIFHMCGRMGIDLNKEVALKMAYNQKRPYRHGNLRS